MIRLRRVHLIRMLLICGLMFEFFYLYGNQIGNISPMDNARIRINGPRLVEKLDKGSDQKYDPKKAGEQNNEFKKSDDELKYENVKKCTVYPIFLKEERPDFECVPMPTGLGDVDICIYDPSVDKFISAALKNHERWEENSLRIVEKIFEKYPKFHFIDLGANIGIYTLTALKFGKKVLAVDPNKENLRRIRASFHRNKFYPLDSAVLVQNAISDKYEKIQLKPNAINVGGRGIMPAKSTEDAADAVYMDDLLEVVPFDKAIMKIDIETAEARAMAHAEKMFDKVDIPIVLMEWNYVKNDVSGSARVRKFFESRGYSAYDRPFDGKVLTGDHSQWDYDIYWIRTKNSKFPAISIQ